MSGKFIKGALIEFMPTFLVPLPNVISFQYNPETMSHTWTQAEASSSGGKEQGSSNPLAVSGLPGESFSFTLMMDARDSIANGNGSIAERSGIYARLAALEMLLYPTGAFGGGLLGAVGVSVSLSLSDGLSIETGVKGKIPQSELPVVLFVWGAGRIVPVRVVSLTINEKLYDKSLNPIQAEAQIGLKVLTEKEIGLVQGLTGGLAAASYRYTQGLRQVLAAENLDDADKFVIGMLPI
jgi:Contractile injection system tube protein